MAVWRHRVLNPCIPICNAGLCNTQMGVLTQQGMQPELASDSIGFAAAGSGTAICLVLQSSCYKASEEPSIEPCRTVVAVCPSSADTASIGGPLCICLTNCDLHAEHIDSADRLSKGHALSVWAR